MKKITIPHRVYLSIIQAATLKGPITPIEKTKKKVVYLIDARYGSVMGVDKNGEYFLGNQKEKEGSDGKNPK